MGETCQDWFVKVCHAFHLQLESAVEGRVTVVHQLSGVVAIESVERSNIHHSVTKRHKPSLLRLLSLDIIKNSFKDVFNIIKNLFKMSSQ